MKTTNKIIAYYRVSTKRQGLGLDAQRSAVQAYAAANGLTIVEEISEKESGKEYNRPGLNLAIAKTKKHNAYLVASKADRIARCLALASDIWFMMGIRVIALNLPEEAQTDPLLFGVYFGLAQKESEMISERTKEALAALKAKGVKLGRPDAAITNEMREAAAAARKTAADSNPANIAAAQELRRYFAATPGKRNLSAAARHLNDAQLYTSRGVFHTAQSVKLLIKRYDL